MTNAQNHDSPATGNLIAKGMPQPLGWMAGFISNNFSKMPQLIQITVFLAFVIYFMFATLRLLWPLIFPSEYIEIRGDVLSVDCSPLPDSLVKVEFSGEGLFVYKKPVGLGDKFTYEWILKVPRTRGVEKLWIALTMFSPELRRPIILASEAFSPKELQNKKDSAGKVHLIIDNPVTRIAVANCDNEKNTTLSGAFIADFFVRSAVAASAQKEKRSLSADSVYQLIHDYEKFLNPVAQLRVMEKLSQGDTNAVYIIANKLKKAVVENSTAQVTIYAPLLTSIENITILSDTTVFNKKFYSKAIDMVATGPAYASHNMAVLLQKLHDPRMLDYVFEHFTKSENARLRNLLISILEGFQQERNKPVREKIVNWLKEKQKTEKSPLVERSIREKIKKLNEK